MKRNFLFLTMIFFCILLAACQANPTNLDLILATTTSTQDSGLLDELLPIFEQDSGYRVKSVAVGSGQAMKMGEDGNADILLVHAPASELVFMESGFGAERFLVMHNDFVLVGPWADSVGIQAASSAADALIKIADAQAQFISRGDDSGTHKKELILWQDAGVIPEGEWYQEAGQGMGATLKIASEKGAYTLTDRATYLANQEILELAILFEGDPMLLNVYHVITVNPEKWPEVNVDGAKAFAEFLVSNEAQELIAEFGVEKFGQPLFFPDAGRIEAELGLP